MLKVIEAYPPPATKGKYENSTQHSNNVTSVCIFANMPQYVKEPAKRYP
jgi:GTP-binding protein